MTLPVSNISLRHEVPTGRAHLLPAHPTWLQSRSCGVLAHVSSLPGVHGIGDLGEVSRDFVDLLANAGVRHWQICPIGPTGYGDSPYQSFSGNAGNPYFIDLQELVAAGLLQHEELKPLRNLDADAVDYGALYQRFWPILALAYVRFLARGSDTLSGFGSFTSFREENGSWLEPYIAFMALKAIHGGAPWNQWEETWRAWSPGLVERLPVGGREIAECHAFGQFLFFAQWRKLRLYAASHQVQIIGDVPIFPAYDSADVWQHREVFQIGLKGEPIVVAGVPPDYYSDAGQYWGNPLYDWHHLERTGYAWWVERLQRAFALFDAVRLDHFRAFSSYWEIPATAPDARSGRWCQGPGAKFFDAVQARLPDLRLIAEDLGYIDADVALLRRHAGLPGMKVLQFGYGHDDNNVNLPHFFPPACVVYTGTHDNVTTRGWIEALDPERRAKVDEYFRLQGGTSAWPVIEAAIASVAQLAVIPLQDLLDLPASATLNRPGTSEGNWRWRATRGELERLRSEKMDMLLTLIRRYDRNGDPRQREYSAHPGE